MNKYLTKLLKSKNKNIELNKQFFIFNLWKGNEAIIVDLIFKKVLYKGIVIENGDIFPTPEKEAIVSIDELSLRFDESLELRLFAKVSTSKGKFEDNLFISEKFVNIVLFEEEKTIETLKEIANLTNINEINSNIFQVNEIKENIIYMKSILDMIEYQKKVMKL